MKLSTKKWNRINNVDENAMKIRPNEINTIKAKNLRMDRMAAVCWSIQPSTESMAQAVANLASVNLYLEPGEALKVWFMKTIPR